MAEIEIFKDIEEKGIPKGLYKISNTGVVLSLRSNRVIKLNKDKDGYLLAHLSYKGVRVCRKVHRLVMKYFYEDSNLLVNHKDGNKKNNNLNNLEYVTHSENMKHAFKMGVLTKTFKRKLSNEIIIEIRKLKEEGMSYEDIYKLYPIVGFKYLKRIINREFYTDIK